MGNYGISGKLEGTLLIYKTLESFTYYEISVNLKVIFVICS